MTVRAKEIGAYILPGGVKDPRPGLEQAKVAEKSGLGAIWLGERIDTKDFPSVLGAVSQVTEEIMVGVGVTAMNIRHPVVLASEGQTLQALLNGRFRMGFGRSAAWRWEGYGVPAPTLASMRDTAMLLRRLWTGEVIAYEGPAGKFPNIRLPQITGIAPPPLFLAAIGPKTLALAGEAYDGAILHPFLTVEAVHESVQIVRNAAEKAGKDPMSVKIVATIVSAPDMSVEDGEEAIESRGAGYIEVPGLGDSIIGANRWDKAEHAAYRANPKLTALGGKPADKNLSRAELIALAKVLPAHWIPSSSARGTSAEVAAIYRKYLAAGADEILVHGATAPYLGGVISEFTK